MRYPENFPGPDAGGYAHDRCPFRVLNEPDPVTDTVIDLAQDYRRGAVPGWPEAYPAGLVDAARQLAAAIAG